MNVIRGPVPNVLGILMMAAACSNESTGAEHWPDPTWRDVDPAVVDMRLAPLLAARDYALSGGGSGCVIRHGLRVLTWGNQKTRYDLKSTTKSIGGTALGLALGDGKVGLHDPAVKHHPSFGVPPQSNASSPWLPRITLWHLATQTAGFQKSGGYTSLIFAPGTRWSYSDGGPNWLAECLTLAYHEDLALLLTRRVWKPLGITATDLTWRKNAYRPPEIDGIPRREFGSGIHADVDAMARIGLLYLRRGRWRKSRILPEDFVRQVATTPAKLKGLPEADPKHYGNASDHYGLLWWNNADGTLADVPRDAFWSWGLYESLIFVVPSLDLVVARAGQSWQRRWGGHYAVLEPFFTPIVTATHTTAAPGAAEKTPARKTEAHPPSPVIESLQWDPVDSIVRGAEGSDTWPLTWADDGHMYSAFGDGWGFAPPTGTRKLSLGLARIEGGPNAWKGVNIPSPTGERLGDGRNGVKASGMLMVDGILYMLGRNAGNARLAWSVDHAVTWTWCDWRFTESFGCPSFVNAGRNYADARDEFVYLVSPDADTAYERADGMVLARVHRDHIRERQAYRFFQGLDHRQKPLWTSDIAQRRPVFTNPGRCYRGSITYNAGLKRYLWCQTGLGKDTRFAGGLAIYDAPELWGPWTTVFRTDSWDVGPGESSSFPCKWMSADGRRLYLVFSGKDSFSVRGATLIRRTPMPRPKN